MGWFDGGKQAAPPPAPDPAVTAAAQAKANNDAAQYNAGLNRFDTTNPYGTQTWTHTAGVDANDPGKWAQTIAYNPAQQKLLDTQTSTEQQAYDLANSQFPRVANTLNSNFKFDGPGMAGPVNVNPGYIANSFAGGGPITNSYDSTNTYGSKNSYDSANTYASGGDIQHNLDYSKVPGLVGGDALAGERQKQSDAIYGEAKRNLDPRYQQDEQKVSNDLVNRGVAVGSPAFTTAMSNFRQSRDSAYADAQDRATQGGVTAANTLFGQGLSARKQGVGEVNDQGQFTNQAQSLAEQEAAARASFGNTANANLAAFGNEANRNLAEFGNTANSNLAQFKNSAQAQQFDQNRSQAVFGNTAQSQKYAQDMAIAQQNAQLQNAAHGASYNEQVQQREMPLQEIGGLLGTGPGVGSLNFQPAATVNTNAPNYEGDVNSNYTNQLAAYDANQKRQGSTMGGLFSALGTLGGGAFGMGGLLSGSH